MHNDKEVFEEQLNESKRLHTREKFSFMSRYKQKGVLHSMNEMFELD